MTLQERLREGSINVPYDEFNLMHKAADRIDADEALMREAVGAMQKTCDFDRDAYVDLGSVITKFRARLEMK